MHNYGLMPRHTQPEQLAEYNPATQVLRLCAPLTPSRNIIDKWRASKRYSEIIKFRNVTLDHLKAQVLCTLGLGYPKPWADQVDVRIVRCSNTSRHLDQDNIIGGCKITLDCLQMKFGGFRTWYEGVGLIKDDTSAHLKISFVESRLRGRYGGLGVGTWLYIRKLR